MKLPVLFAFPLLVLFGTFEAHATSCASELAVSEIVPAQSLPRACAAMGPLRLGMTYAEMIAAMGVPNSASSRSVGNRDAVYVFPRDLGNELKRHPIPQTGVHFGYVELTFRDDKVVAIDAFIPPPVIFPYSLGGIAIDQTIDNLRAQIKAPLDWNASRDHAWLGAYPIGVDVGASGKIVGIHVDYGFNPHASPGYTPRFWWITDPTSGLIRGYRVTLGPVCKRGLLAAC